MEEKQRPVTHSTKKLTLAATTTEIAADLTTMVTHYDLVTTSEGKISPSEEGHLPKHDSDGEEVGEDGEKETPPGSPAMVRKFTFTQEASQPECGLPSRGIQPCGTVTMHQKNSVYCIQILVVQADTRADLSPPQSMPGPNHSFLILSRGS